MRPGNPSPATTPSELSRIFKLTNSKFVVTQVYCSASVLETTSHEWLATGHIFLVDHESGVVAEGCPKLAGSASVWRTRLETTRTESNCGLRGDQRHHWSSESGHALSSIHSCPNCDSGKRISCQDLLVRVIISTRFLFSLSPSRWQDDHSDVSYSQDN